MRDLEYHRATILTRDDVEFIVTLLAVSEGAVLSGDMDSHTLNRIFRSLSERGLLKNDASERSIRQALNVLNHKFRYLLGEYEEYPGELPVED